MIPCWQDDPEEMAYSQNDVLKVLKWGIPQRVKPKEWSNAYLKEVCRKLDIGEGP